MSLFKQFATDRKAEAEGVLFDPNGEGTLFRLARRNRMNKRWRKMINAETKPYKAAIESPDGLDPDVDNKISVKVFCHTILLGWEKMDEPDVFDQDEYEGEYVPYTPERGIKLMEAIPDLYDILSEQSAKAANYRDQEIEKDAKN